MLDPLGRAAYNRPVFGLSFAKLIVLAAVFAAAWYGIRYLQMRSEQPLARRRPGREDAARADGGRPAGSPAGAHAAPAGPAEDLLKCPVCATYVTRGASRCGRADCPY